MDDSPRKPRPDGVTVSRVLPLRAEDAWALLTDVRNHARWVPLTRVTVNDTLTSATDPGPAPVPAGARFTAVTGPWAGRGAPGLVDRMVVEHLQAPRTDDAGPGSPGVATYRKLGPVLLGTAGVQVRPLGPGTCEVRWFEDVHLRGLPRRLTAAVLRPVARAVVGLTLGRVAREVAATHRPRTP